MAYPEGFWEWYTAREVERLRVEVDKLRAAVKRSQV